MNYKVAIPFLEGDYEEYFSALRSVGLNPIQVNSPIETAACDALLIPGGVDINPKRYGEECNGSLGIDDKLDELQFRVLDTYVKAKKPILGICRGLQLINVYYGGTLYQNLDTADSHKQIDGADQFHAVNILEESMLFSLYGSRERYNLRFNITAEMRRENNQRLIAMDDNTDFIVSSNMSSLFLAQLAESPELIIAFEELLSNEGNEVYLKPAYEMGCSGEMSVAEIRQRTLKCGYIFIGYNRPCAVGFDNIYNPPLNEIIAVGENDKLIVIGEE